MPDNVADVWELHPGNLAGGLWRDARHGNLSHASDEIFYGLDLGGHEELAEAPKAVQGPEDHAGEEEFLGMLGVDHGSDGEDEEEVVRVVEQLEEAAADGTDGRDEEKGEPEPGGETGGVELAGLESAKELAGTNVVPGCGSEVDGCVHHGAEAAPTVVGEKQRCGYTEKEGK